MSVAPEVGVAVIINTVSRLLDDRAAESLSYSVGLPPVHLALRVPRGLLGHWDRAAIDHKMRTGAKLENPSTTVDAY